MWTSPKQSCTPHFITNFTSFPNQAANPTHMKTMNNSEWQIYTSEQWTISFELFQFEWCCCIIVCCCCCVMIQSSSLRQWYKSIIFIIYIDYIMMFYYMMLIHWCQVWLSLCFVVIPWACDLSRMVVCIVRLEFRLATVNALHIFCRMILHSVTHWLCSS